MCKKRRVAGRRCTLKPATIVGNWCFILQRDSQKLYNACASDLFHLEVMGAGIFLAQLYQSLARGTPLRCQFPSTSGLHVGWQSTLMVRGGKALQQKSPC